MSLYDGLGLDTGPKKEDTADAKKSDLAGWSTGIRLMQSQLRIKKAALTEAQRRIRHTTLPPVVDLKKSNEEKGDFMLPPQPVYSSKSTKPVIIEEDASFSKPSPFISGGEPTYPDVEDEYNPLWPNEYDKIVKARRDRRQKERELERMKDIEERDGNPSGRRRDRDRDRDRDRMRDRGDRDRYRDRRDRDHGRDRSPRGFSRRPDSDEEIDFEERERERERRRSGHPIGAAIAPPASLIQEDSQANNDNEDRFMPPSKPLLEKHKILAPKSLVPSYDADPERSTTPPPGSSFGNISPPPPSMMSSMDQPPRSMVVSTFQAPVGLGAGSVAAKIMAKYGFKEGQGLGKSEQGMSSALQVEKTSKRGGKIIAGDKPVMPVEPLPPPPPPVAEPPGLPKTQGASDLTEAMRNPSKVVLLRNMVGPGEVDDDLEPETAEECTKYGKVTRVLIFELPGGTEDEAVRIFVEFERLESAIKAVVDLNGRFFGGRTVKAGFFDPKKKKVPTATLR